jgi:phycocyanobilin:ferredoxin oxidoreductase
MMQHNPTLNHRELKSRQHSLIQNLADCIESTWKQHLDLSPYVIPQDLGYIENHLEGEKLQIENHCYQTPQFRKLHLELARMGDHLDILHCVMFPRTEYSLPMFGTDIVVGRGSVSAAIVDLSPIGDRHLPPTYDLALSQLPPTQFSQIRDLPEWGDIFSRFCLFVRPVDELEEQAFLQRVQQFLTIHCKFSVTMLPTIEGFTQERNLAGQNYYCTKQQQNDKTRRVLEKFFGTEWTDRYMSTLLFDCAVANVS